MVLLFAVLGIALSALLSLKYLEKPRSTFASFANMEAAGMIDAGWLPDYLPKSAVNIEERHDLDTNEVWASFAYHPGDVEAVRGVCTKIAENDRGSKYICPPFDARTSTIVLTKNGTGYYRSYPNGI